MAAADTIFSPPDQATAVIRKISFDLVVLALVGCAAHAQGPGHRCSINKLRGQYGFKIDGSSVEPAPSISRR
ncbi:MAG: hypothetical protein JWQ49_818 [Edaphobacter sp.]|nr:hypothetical protein [Edaphobacter sp.]